MGDYQVGFRRGRSCAEQIFNLKSVLFNNKERTKWDIVVIFLYFRTAFDSIHRFSLFKILNELRADTKTINAIRETLTGTLKKFGLLEERSEAFEIKTRVRRVSGFSPILFNCALEGLIKEQSEYWEGKEFITQLYRNKRIVTNHLAFSDELLLMLVNNPEWEKTKLEQHEIRAAKIGLPVEKTEGITNINKAPAEIKISQNQ